MKVKLKSMNDKLSSNQNYCGLKLEDWTALNQGKKVELSVVPKLIKKQVEEVKQPFIEWMSVGEQKLPPIVREELIRAAIINFESGAMNKLKLYAQFRELTKKWGFWIFILIIIWYWL